MAEGSSEMEFEGLSLEANDESKIQEKHINWPQQADEML